MGEESIGTQDSSAYVTPGMPPLDLSGRSTSFFEFWPAWVMYFPVAIQWLVLSIRYRSLSLPLLANPAVFLSGMVGVSKSAVFDAAGMQARKWILDWISYELTDQPVDEQLARLEELIGRSSFTYPLVAKPELGCRGIGVKLMQDSKQLLAFLENFPPGSCIQLQRLSEWEPEAGIFYVRYPDKQRGEIFSLALKYTPYVVGDGERTLKELIAADPRAGELMSLYESRHRHHWDTVPEKGKPQRLIFAASHSRGAIFREASDYITDALSQTLDKIFADIPGVYYGRLDVKFRDMEALMRGEDFDIIEINGASSESINIWDRNTGFSAAVKTLLMQYSILFRLGYQNRKLGHKTPGLPALIRAWRKETKLLKSYPQND